MMKYIHIALFIAYTFTCSSQNSSGMYFRNDTLFIVKADGSTVQISKNAPVLVSGTTVKTINGNSIVGSGDLGLSAGFIWGNATGTLSNQTDLQNALTAKANLASPVFTGTPIGIGLPIFARVTGSNATTTGQALVDITGLSVPLFINAVYEFEANLSVQSSSTAGNQYGVNYSVAGGTVEAQISGTLAAATSRSDRISALNTAAAAYITSGATGGIRIQGIISTGANSGNFTISHLKTTSGTSTVFINSYLKLTRIL